MSDKPTATGAYSPQAIEQAAQAHWRATDAYRVHEDTSRPKYYACSMLPYPSGKLHMGHVRNYTINDMLARQLRMKGYNVLMPMGWDAFGLPAENAAMKNGVPPARWTYDNIAHMKGQMQAMGLAIDWSREMAACDPRYYKWNQWLFLKMLEKGIAYRKTQVVNWDPVDQTVLANEQVIDGKGWRTGATVEKREIPGYYLKITDYAQELLDHVQMGNPKATLSGWPDKVRLMQENWIGRSEGVRFAFPHDIRAADGQAVGGGRMYVFTTRADTIMGVTFCAVAPEHPLATHAAQTNPKLAAFIEDCKKGGTTEAELALRDKEGLDTGLTVNHPLTGAAVPLWVGNYVLMSYGDGAVMGVPAHDERDFAFALKYGIEIRQVVRRAAPSGPSAGPALPAGDDLGTNEASAGNAVPADFVDAFDASRWQDWYADKHGGVCVNSGVLDGLAFKAAVDKVAELLAGKRLGEKLTTWRLRDWGISRQRYWGTPIPIIHCPEHGAVPVPEKDLPVVLPEDCIPDGSGNPLNRHEGFHAGVTCPVCGKPARRETDTMDTFVDSSWYFIRYCLPEAQQQASAAMTSDAVNYWMPKAGGANGAGMDQYIGGIEHAILHLLYARFWTKVMRDMGLLQVDEPFTRLLCQGMVLNHSYFRKGVKGGIEWFWPHEVEHLHDEHGKMTGVRHKADGQSVEYGGVTTMSKSKNNGVDPQDLIDKYGADTARLYMMFTAPPEATLEWNDGAVEGSYRFLRRVWAFGQQIAAIDFGAFLQRTTYAGGQNDPRSLKGIAFGKPAAALRREVHSVLRQIDYDYGRMQYNTVVSGCMKLLNALDGFKPAAGSSDGLAVAEGFGILLRALYPATPHLAHALWRQLGYEQRFGSILDAPWPQVDEAALVQDEVELVLQVNGKTRGAIRVSAQADKAAIEAVAVAAPELAKFNEGKPVRKVIIVPGRLVNLVV